VTTAGPNSTGTVADGGEFGGFEWTTPTNATASDNSYAVSNAALANSLKATNFGFSIPAGATINGMVFEWEGKTGAGTQARNIKAIKDGSTLIASNHSVTFTTTEGYQTAGTSTDLFGTTWTVSEINSANFGCGCDAGGITNAISIDHIRATVYYTDAATGAKLSQSKLVAPGVLGRLAQ